MKIVDYKNEFRQSLLSWYYDVKRDLPWRRTDNPYYIWVSEVMLQQTRVDTVIPYYERFIEQYPTMEKLAYADEDALLKMWEGLGYYSRARNLQKGVREVVENYNSVVPNNRTDIQTLRGVGPYTAGAVLSIAYGIPEHAVDGNVMRVLSRLLLIEDDIAIAKTKKVFEEVVMDLIDKEDPSAFNQGLMELGATICAPKPACLLCPVREYCRAFEEGRQEELPVKTKKKSTKVIPVGSFAIQDGKGNWLLRRRPEKGLLANLWEFPMIELNTSLEPEEAFKETFKTNLATCSKLIEFTHIFSHLKWEVNGYHGSIKESGSLPEGYEFFTTEQVNDLPMPVPVLKVWEVAQKKMFLN